MIHSTVGSITKTDIQYAQAYECPIYCFRVKRPLQHERRAIDRLAVQALYFQHHQHLIDQMEDNMLREYQRRGEQADKKAKGKGVVEAVGSVEETMDEAVDAAGGEEGEQTEVASGSEDADDGREEWERFVIDPSQLQGERQQAEG